MFWPAFFAGLLNGVLMYLVEVVRASQPVWQPTSTSGYTNAQ